VDTSCDDVPAETQGCYQVIGIRANGERIVISKHASRVVAEKVIRLTQNSADFKEITIEVEA
jgi:hypothetical protein